MRKINEKKKKEMEKNKRREKGLVESHISTGAYTR
jgi:hypothetical protein